ncbi:MAG: tyrosine-type recombinase/integrase [Faecalibacillus sp.]
MSLYHLTNKKTITDQEANQLSPELYEEIKKRRDRKIPTFYEIFEIIYKDELSKLSSSASKGYRSWINHFKQIHERTINTISLQDLQEIFDNDKSGHGTKMHMKVLCSKIFEYSVMHRYINRDDDYTEYIKLGKRNSSTKHYAFSNKEIRLLMNDNDDIAKILLIYIFSGLRANELLNIKREDVHIDEVCSDDGVERVVSYFVTGSKTDAGKNRIVPIHHLIKPFIIELILKKEKRIIDCDYNYFRIHIVNPFLEKKQLKHTLHDTRVTFTTLCQLNNVDLFSRKRILGHKMKDITFDTYTSTVINKLYEEIQKIKI